MDQEKIKNLNEIIANNGDSIKEIIVICDGTTNGELLKMLFPKKKVWQDFEKAVSMVFESGNLHIFSLSWWNSKYDREEPVWKKK